MRGSRMILLGVMLIVIFVAIFMLTTIVISIPYSEEDSAKIDSNAQALECGERHSDIASSWHNDALEINNRGNTEVKKFEKVVNIDNRILSWQDDISLINNVANKTVWLIEKWSVDACILSNTDIDILKHWRGKYEEYRY